MRAFTPVLGQHFGMLKVVEEVRPPVGQCHNRKVGVVCKCAEGRSFSVRVGELRSGHTRSCGCAKRMATAKTGKANATHGLERHRLYGTWHQMQQRCSNPKHVAYRHYGGRGIVVAPEWTGDAGLKAFIEWSEAHGAAKGLELDRIDNNLGYCPGNCRWVTRSVNGRNRRNNRKVTFNGRDVTIAEAAELTGLPRGTIRYRLVSGWPADQALHTPAGGRKKC